MNKCTNREIESEAQFMESLQNGQIALVVGRTKHKNFKRFPTHKAEHDNKNIKLIHMVLKKAKEKKEKFLNRALLPIY